MHGYIVRNLQEAIFSNLEFFPIVAILGPRQCGKSTLAREIIKVKKNSVYLDLESPEDLNKLSNPEYFFRMNAGRMICLDEIQRRADLFPVLRSIVDRKKETGQVLILGSTSQELIRQSSESLAGRIAYDYLTPFTMDEITDHVSMEEHWLKGGYPDSTLADELFSWKWRENFLTTFVERDIPQFGFRIPSRNLIRFLTMVAHTAGQVVNRSKLGESLGLSYNTITSYFDIFTETFLIRMLSPLLANLKKRIIKSPKIYIRDTGLLHKLLGIRTFNDLLGHPVAGSSWESYCIENILSVVDYDRASFYRTSNGGEIDLILERGNKRIALEFKISTAPKLSRGFWNGLDDLEIQEAWVICPVKEQYTIRDGVRISGLFPFLDKNKSGGI